MLIDSTNGQAARGDEERSGKIGEQPLLNEPGSEIDLLNDQ